MKWFTAKTFILLLTVILAGIGFYFYKKHFVWVDTVVNNGYGEAARKNPFFAAQRYLESYDIAVINGVELTQNVLDKLQPDDAVVLLNTDAIKESLYTPVRAWLSQGGHLIMEHGYLWDEETQDSGDAFLDAENIRLYEYDIDYHYKEYDEDEEYTESEHEEDNEILGDESGDSETDTACAPDFDYDDYDNLRIELADNNHINLKQSSSYYLQWQTDKSAEITPLTIEELNQHQLLQVRKDKGFLTVLSHSDFWRNHYISDYDHALLLKLLTQNYKRVWIIYGNTSDSLSTLIWRHLWAPVIGGLCLLALYLYYRSVRFGPLAPTAPRNRRSALEHVQANAVLQWRHQNVGALIETLRQDIKNRSTTAKPVVNRSTSDSTFLTDEQRDWAINAPIPRNDADLVTMVKYLQQLLKEIRKPL